MKKSEVYRLAQIAVISTQSIELKQKPDILRELIEAENLAKYCEEKRSNNG